MAQQYSPVADCAPATQHEPGCYWISLTSASEVDLGDGEHWMFVGSDMTVRDQEVEVIGPRLGEA